jgi:hypothetical protein
MVVTALAGVGSSQQLGHDLLRDEEITEREYKNSHSKILNQYTDTGEVVTDFAEFAQLTVLHVLTSRTAGVVFGTASEAGDRLFFLADTLPGLRASCCLASILSLCSHRIAVVDRYFSATYSPAYGVV